MNFAGIGEEIAVIKDIPKFKKIKISIANDEDIDDDFDVDFKDTLKIDTKVGHFQFIPDRKKRLAMCALGQNGMGKSFFIKDVTNEFKKVFPNVKIFLFSSKNEDKELDNIEGLKRVKIDKSIIEKPFNYECFENTLTIFDDVDAFEKKIRDAIYLLRDQIYKNGRSKMMHIISSNHQLANKNETSVLLNESYVIVFFLQSYNRNMRYLLENYVGLDMNAIKKLRKNKTRATVFIRTYPAVILQAKNMYTLPYLLDEDIN
jgi:hypothetical protein